MVKKLHISALLFFTFCSFGAYAQGLSQADTKIDTKEYISFLTTGWKDNIYIGAGGGGISRFSLGEQDDIRKSFITPIIDVNVSKWFTPSFGVRLGGYFSKGKEGLYSYEPYAINHSAFRYVVNGTTTYVKSSPEAGDLYYNSVGAYADIMWNIRNTFGDFNPEQFFNFGPYISGGFTRLYDHQDKKGLFSPSNDNEFTLGVGVFNTFRINRRWNVTLDLRMNSHASRYRTNYGVRTLVPSLYAGVSYNLFPSSWITGKSLFSQIEAAEAQAEAAQDALDDVQGQYEELNETVERLNEELHIQEKIYEEETFAKVVGYDQMKELARGADLVVYYYINVSSLNFSETYHLSQYAEQVLKNDPNHVFYVTGSADVGTGTTQINNKLSYERAQFVKNYLVKNYKVNPKNIITYNVVTNKHADGALDRCAIIDSKPTE